jgi:hypothetical protein
MLNIYHYSNDFLLDITYFLAVCEIYPENNLISHNEMEISKVN